MKSQARVVGAGGPTLRVRSPIRNRTSGGSRGPKDRLHGSLLYREEQSLGWPWPGMLLALLCAVTFASVSMPFGFGVWTQLIEGRPWGDHPMSNAALLAVAPLAILGSLLPLLALSARLTIEVRTDGLGIRLTRLGGRLTMRREEVDEARLVRLGPLDIGRTQRWRRRVYRMAGSEGVELRKANGWGTVVISSERPQAFLRAVRSMLEPEPNR
jgi:hypothetical protein